MTTLTRSPRVPAPPAPTVPPATPPAGGEPAAGWRDAGLLVATAALIVTACLPLTRVYVELDFLRPVLLAALLALGVGWGTRRLHLGPITGLALNLGVWGLFVSVAFLGDASTAGVLPSAQTPELFTEMWLRGIDLLRGRPAPVIAEPSLLLLTTSGVWAVTHMVDNLVFRLGAPLRAISASLLLWVVPLSIAGPTESAWPWAVLFLAAAALLMLTASEQDVARWGHWVPARTRSSGAFGFGAVAIAAAAITAGALFAPLLPGYAEPPWYEVRSLGGTTVTTNPIVNIRSSLVSPSPEPVLRVITERPLYLRTASLDLYSVGEEWTNTGIRGTSVRDGQSLPFEVPIEAVEWQDVEISVISLPGAVLVPAPYQAASVSGPLVSNLQYDRSRSSFTLERGVTLTPGDRYEIETAIPTPGAEALDAFTSLPAPPELTALPDNVPGRVAELSEEIVTAAGAETPFRQALAIQEELRSWTYSLDPPQGHHAQAMEAFLEHRIGYCEQFAGTMAVMLRTLGIPARVAVGYSPGERLRPGLWEISNANAHAWVEVLFPRYGWIAFEPTPRDDGNVLVPSAFNLAPTQVEQESRGDQADDQGADQEPETPDFPDAPPLDAAEPPVGSGGMAGDSGRGGWPTTAIVLIGLALAGATAVLLGLGGRRHAHGSAVERVIIARDQVTRVARGMGLPTRPWETDREFLGRIGDGGDATVTLIRLVELARWAPELPPEAAAQAEQAADQLCTQLTAALPRSRRLLVGLRGRLIEGRMVASDLAGALVARRSRSPANESVV